MKKTIMFISMFLTLAMLTSVVSCTKTANDATTDTHDTTTAQDNQTQNTPTIDLALKAEVEAVLDSKHKLTFNDDGSFRVLILADTHMNAGSNATNLKNVQDRIKFLVDKEDPNLVIFTGDNTINSSKKTIKTNISAIVGYIEEKQIPWCHVYGNHDHENALPNKEQQPYFESYDYCISKAGPEDISGVGNYVNGIYNKDGSLGAVIYCLDSGAYDTVNGGYDYIKQDQIDWYKETSEKIQQYNGGVAVPALMAFHIPLIENMHAFNSKDNTDVVLEYSGNKNEDICSSKTDTKLFETVLQRGDVKAIVTGHDHVNDYMYNYKGVKLCSSPNFSEFTYNDQALWGARSFDMNLATINNMPTHVTYINEKTDVSKLEAYKSDTTFEYTEDAIKSAVIQNWNGGALTGTASVAISADKGVNNSSSLVVKRDKTNNFEFYFNISNQGKLGELKYLVVWADFTDVEFRKACFGVIANGDLVYRTDDADYISPIYYLADGSSEWVTLKHGSDGCFGVGDSGSQAMKGKKGYFAIPVEYVCRSSNKLTAESPILGFYFYGSLQSDTYANVPFYLDNMMLVKDYKTIGK